MKNNPTKKKKIIYTLLFGFFCIAFGVFFQSNGIGLDFISPLWTLGKWLIYVGLLSIFLVGVRSIRNKEKKVDERMQYIGMKASRITFLGIVFGAFFIMILDGIQKITIPYSLFMGDLLCFILLVYFVSYKILERRY